MLYISAAACALVGIALANPVDLGELNNRQAQGADFTGSTQNGLQGACKSNIIVFARGTTEGGNVGTLTGPPFFQAVAQKVGPNNLAVQGVEYPADIPGFLAGGDANGSKMMAQLVQQAVQKCPDSNVVMSGYSQGGQLVHNAAQAMPAAMTAKVSAVIFGDPDNGKPVQGVAPAKTKVICHQGDNICEGGIQIKQEHLTYGKQNAVEAASFVASMAAGARKNATVAAAKAAAGRQ